MTTSCEDPHSTVSVLQFRSLGWSRLMADRGSAQTGLREVAYDPVLKTLVSNPGKTHRLCLVLALPPRPKHCLNLVFTLPSWLQTHCLCLLRSHCIRDQGTASPLTVISLVCSHCFRSQHTASAAHGH